MHGWWKLRCDRTGKQIVNNAAPDGGKPSGAASSSQSSLDFVSASFSYARERGAPEGLQHRFK